MDLKKFDASNLLKALFHSKMIDADEAKRVHANIKENGATNAHPLVEIANSLPSNAKDPSKKISLEQLTEWLADYLSLEYLHLDPLKIDVGSITQVISHQYAKQYGLLPVFIGDAMVKFATINPLDNSWQDKLSSLLRKEIELVIANPKDIERYQNEFYSLAKSINKSKLNDDDTNNSLQKNLEQLVDLGRRGQLDAEDHHIVQVVDWLLQYAFEQRASDIHLEPRKERGEIRFRIDGILHYAYQVPPNVMLAIIGRIKTLGRMDIAERRRPLDGRLKTRTPEGKEIELRLSTVPTAMGEKMVMRIFDPEVLQRSFNELGLNDRELSIWNKQTKQTNGIILVTGPTGSGKTTTLYSTLRKLASSEVNVCTIEDPIEMVEPSFNQIQVHHGIDMDFASGIRSLLRQDPDIIMIGEIRDLETAEMAIQASLTGHLVLSTLHTNDAPSAITRMMELGVPAYLINATLLGVMAQRLVRTLCPSCKAPHKIEEEEWKALIGKEKLATGNAAKPVGCLECRQTGYLGRIGLYEMLELTRDVKKLVRPDSDLEALRDQSRKDGLQTLRISGAKKIVEGLTTLEEVLRVAPITDY